VGGHGVAAGQAVSFLRRHPVASGWVLLGVLLAAAFAPVVAGRQSLLALDAGVMPDGPYGYDGPRPVPAVLDPAASAIKYVPYTKLVSDMWRRGEVPFWNPYNGCGVPLWANGEAFACAPLRLPLYVSPSPAVWNAYYLLRLWLAGGLALSLALGLGLGFLPALSAGAAYMLSGYLVMGLNLFHLDVDVLLPGLLLALDRLCRSRSRVAFAGAAAFAWAMCLGGSQQALLVDLVLAAAWVLVRAGGRAALVRAVLAAACGAVGALPHWLPFLELLRRSYHLHGIEGLRTGASVLPISSLTALPGPWASAAAGAVPFYYAGAAVCALAIAGAWLAWGAAPRSAAGRMTAIAFRILAVAALLELAKIFGAPGSGLVGSLPVAGLVWWGKYTAPLFLALAMLAAYAIERLTTGSTRAVPWTRLALVAAVAAELVWLRPGPHPAPHDPLRPAPYIGWLQERIAREPGWRICGVGTVLIPDMAAAFRLPDVRLEDTLIDRDQYRLLFDGISAPKPPRMSMFITLDALDRRRLDSLRGLGVRYLLAARDWRPAASVAPALGRVYDREIAIWRVSGAKPFAGFPERGRGWFRAGCIAGATLGPGLLLAGLVLL